MAVERTLSIIKPDAVVKNVIGAIYARFEKAGLKIVAARMIWLSRADAEGFYAVHRERPFFKDLVGFMTTGPVMIQVLEGELWLLLPSGEEVHLHPGDLVIQRGTVHAWRNRSDRPTWYFAVMLSADLPAGQTADFTQAESYRPA